MIFRTTGPRSRLSDRTGRHAEVSATTRRSGGWAPPVGLPFAHLNLRRNPFGQLEPEELARLSVTCVDRFVGRLGRPGFAVQFLGAKGRGKTTHLHALRRAFPSAPYVYFPPGAPPARLRRPPARGPLFLDELQRMPPSRRRRLWPRASYAIASHLDHTDELRAVGLEVETVRLTGLEPERLTAIVARRVEAARRGAGTVPAVSPGGIRSLVERHGDDLRAILDRLYDAFQGLPEPRPVRRADLFPDHRRVPDGKR